ncbi:MAG: hypothetical protein COA50_13035 [Flavobacteriaceae bacterium]|nr:MAG: hypothetical protein COA50_13035 [Flavobacteriaceae bacterium]
MLPRTNQIINAICCVLLLFAFSCKREKGLDIQNNDTVTIDSVFLLIKDGRNTSFTVLKRNNALKKAHEKADASTNDSLKTKYFSRLSLAYFRLNDSTLFRDTNKTTMELAQNNKDSIVLAEAHWDLADFFRNNVVQDSAYYHFYEAQKLYDELNNQAYSARMLYNMAIVQNDVRDYTGSEINLIRAIELLKPINYYNRLYSCYNALGNIATSLKEYDKALEYHQKASEYLNLLDSQDDLPMTQNNIGRVYQEQGKHKKAMEYFNMVMSFDSVFYKNTQIYAKALNNLAVSTSILNMDNDQLPALFNQAIHIQDSIKDIKALSLSNYSLGKYYLSKKDTITALTFIRKSKKHAEQSSSHGRLFQVLAVLPNIDPVNATAYAQEYIHLNDSLQQEERVLRNKFVRIRFETDEFIAQNSILDRQRQLWLGISIASILLGLLVFVVISQRVKNQKLQFQQSQQKSNEEIFNLMLSQQGKLEEGKHIEQKRISEELHDGILGQMLGIRLILTGLNRKTDEKTMDQREDFIKKLQLVEEEVRTISHELNHTAYEKVSNFIASIQDLLSTISVTGKFSYDFTYNEEMNWDQLLGDVKINIYRIVQECLQNCVKHAKANNIYVNFNTNDENLIVSIKDDGKGFETKKGKKGIGLKNISSRAEKLNGSYIIESEVERGTTVTLTLPKDKTLA